LLLTGKHNFVEVSKTHPRQVGLPMEDAQELPSLLLCPSLQLAIDAREPPGETIVSRVNLIMRHP
jgi:hypothetical protein